MYQFNNTLTPFQRFAEQILVGDDCWNWTASKRLGYGRFRVGKVKVSVHRFSWEHFNGPIANGLSVLHHCDNPSCVRPSHLFLGTYKDNAQDMLNKGRRAPTHGEDNPRAKLTLKQVREIRNHYRDGISCQSLAARFDVSWGTIWFIVNDVTWTRDRHPD